MAGPSIPPRQKHALIIQLNSPEDKPTGLRSLGAPTIASMDSKFEDLRLDCAAKVAALVDAIRSIPPELSPRRRARTQAIREQIYHGYERPLAKARGASRVLNVYEEDRAWSDAAADLVLLNGARRGTKQFARDHVVEIESIVEELFEKPRNPADTADLLDKALVTCTVLTAEHALLGKVPSNFVGWDRYTKAGIKYRTSLNAS